MAADTDGSSSGAGARGASAAAGARPAVFVTGSIMGHVLTMTSTGAIGLVAIFVAELLDVLFLSLLGDTEIVAAVGYAGPLVFLTVACSIGLSIATVSLVSPAIGRGDRARARRLTGSVLVFTLVTSAALSLALLPFLPSLLAAMGAKGRTAALAHHYLMIVVPSLPPLALAMTASAVLRSLGDAKRAMHVTLGAAVATAILDPILIFGFGLGLTGAAWATVIARVIIMVIAINSIWRVYDMIERPSWPVLAADMKPIFAIALPAIATNAATPVANAIVTAAFAPFGDAAVAGWAVIGRIQPVAFGFVFAMSGSVGPIIGQNLGAGQHARMREAFAAALKVVAFYTAGAWIVLALLADPLIAVFKADGQGARLIGLYCQWMAPLFAFQGALFVANAVFNTLGRPRIGTAINWARAILGTLPFTWIGGIVAGATGVLVGQLVGGVVFGGIAIWLAFRLLQERASGALVAQSEIPIVRPPPAGLLPHAPWQRLSAVAAQFWTAEERRRVELSGAIKDIISPLRERAIALPRPWKRVILAASDFVILAIAVWLSLWMRYGEVFLPPDPAGVLLLFAAPAIGVATFAWFGLYRLVTRYITVRGSGKLIQCIGISAMFWAVLALIFQATWLPRTVILILYPLLGGSLIFISRQLYAIALRSVGVPVFRHAKEPRPVVIYGAGRTGVQLLDALHSSGESRVAGFIDDSLAGQYAGGVKIYKADKLERLIERDGVREVILALPESRRRERRQILKELQKFPVRVKTLPDIADFATGRAEVKDLRPIDVEDLLGRDPVPADPALLALAIRDKAVLVTGAGGSIGSELVRQVLRQNPARLVLMELSEVALFEIEMEVRDAIAAQPEKLGRTEIVCVLGSVCDASLVRRAIEQNRIATIFHAAAYKHVPMVEENPVTGLSNNTFGTRVVAEAARAAGVERFVLISTDKAVRPTNVMGASKRLAELVLQDHAADPACRTVFTMVRFGNVLDSSGSVVQRFRKQIQVGGPVTVTHRDVTRYFMSIPEAASLVLQAGAMAKGGEVFVLDMGEPVKIDELARSMIRLMGLEVKDDDNPDGEVAIQYVGLRPGEKLYEELLIGEDTTPTRHPLIRCSNEPLLPSRQLAGELATLQAAMDANDVGGVRAVLQRTVEGYAPTEPIAEAEKPAIPLAAPSRTLH